MDISLIKNEISLTHQTGGNGENNHNNLTGWLQEVMCYHQGTITEHIYWGAELHKELRISLEKGDLKTAEVKFNDINHDLPELFKSAWRSTVIYLNNFFPAIHKSNHLPRMCIKGTNTVDGQMNIVDIFREDCGKSSLSYGLSKNTGFQSVATEGSYYICNDIPTLFKDGGYKNPRLDTLAVGKYKNNLMHRIKLACSKNNFDEDWAKCWKDYSAEKENVASCYKSTLIIPMTLKNNPQSSQFINGTMVGLHKESRAIYGFLCFDHIEKNYFTSHDVNIGYVIADLLSFYMINHLNFTSYSTTYEQAEKELAS